MHANDRWKDIEAQQNAKAEIKVGNFVQNYVSVQVPYPQLCEVFFPLDSLQSDIVKRIEEKRNERESFELQISSIDISRIDEREKNLVVMSHTLIIGDLKNDILIIKCWF